MDDEYNSFIEGLQYFAKNISENTQKLLYSFMQGLVCFISVGYWKLYGNWFLYFNYSNLLIVLITYLRKQIYV